MKLSKLLEYNNIIIQAHDNPDADALASGMAVLWYLRNAGKNVKFIYGGHYVIQKSNIRLMIKDLGIDIHYVTSQNEANALLGLTKDELPGLLLTVDCQYGEGNVTKFSANKVAIIDHHQISRKPSSRSEIRSNYASCSTVIWNMMTEEGIDVNENQDLATALYYGLMTDSGNFTEVHHPVDRDLMDSLQVNQVLITKFKNANISQNEIKLAALALLGYEYYNSNRYAIVYTEPCDPNILGVISDMLLEVDTVDTCLIYNMSEEGVKISVRSCTVETRADELAAYITEEAGNGGGHIIKAGGFMPRKLLARVGVDFTPNVIHEYLRNRMRTYFEDTEVINTENYKIDTKGMKSYHKKPVSLGYVDGTDVVPAGSRVAIRTLEGDVNVQILEDTIIMIGIRGEIYPTTDKQFAEANIVDDRPYVFQGEYVPTIKSLSDGKSYEILPYAHSCVSSGKKEIYATQIDHRVKIFTKWDKDRYYLGKPGDYLAASKSDISDVYIIEKEIFAKTYEEN